MDFILKRIVRKGMQQNNFIFINLKIFLRVLTLFMPKSRLLHDKKHRILIFDNN